MLHIEDVRRLHQMLAEVDLRRCARPTSNWSTACATRDPRLRPPRGQAPAADGGQRLSAGA